MLFDHWTVRQFDSSTIHRLLKKKNYINEGRQKMQGILDCEFVHDPQRQDRTAFLKACHLFPTLGRVQALISIIVRSLSILDFPMKNMRTYNNRYHIMVVVSPLTKASPLFDLEH
jgi:hypothetical protein